MPQFQLFKAYFFGTIALPLCLELESCAAVLSIEVIAKVAAQSLYFVAILGFRCSVIVTKLCSMGMCSPYILPPTLDFGAVLSGFFSCFLFVYRLLLWEQFFWLGVVLTSL